jgi:MFS family permease
MNRLTAWAVYTNIFLVMLGLGVIAPNLTDIRKSFGVSYAEISWGVSAFALARLVMNLPAGYAAGRLPRLPLLLAGTACVGVGSLAAAMSSGLAMFLAARALSGLGSSLCTTVGLTIILDTAEPDRRGRASGLFHSAIGGGAFFGPGFGGLLSTFGSWRWALGGAALASAVSFVFLAIVVRSGQSRIARPVEVSGSGAAPQRVSVFGLLLAGSVAYVAAFAIFFARGAVQQTLVPLMGREVIGLGTGALSALLMASAGFTSLVGPFAGSLSDRYGRLRLLLPGLALLAMGILLVTLASSAPMFIAGFAVVSLAGTVNSIPSSAIVDSVSGSQRSLAIGVYRVVGDSALTLAPILSGWFTDTQGFRSAGVISAVVVTLALGVALVAGRPASLRRETYPSVAESPVAR